MEGVDALEQTPGFLLGETDSFYGVWDKRSGTSLVQRFPLTEEGFEEAITFLHRLRRRDRRERHTHACPRSLDRRRESRGLDGERRRHEAGLPSYGPPFISDDSEAFALVFRTVESLAFRVWVSILVVVGVLRARELLANRHEPSQLPAG